MFGYPLFSLEHALGLMDEESKLVMDVFQPLDEPLIWEKLINWLGLEVDPSVSSYKAIARYSFLAWMFVRGLELTKATGL